jgi:hypothetical protein
LSRLRIAYIIVFTILISIALSVALSHAGENGGYIKIFEDGVTYIEYTNTIICCGDGGTHYDILYDGVRYTCALDAYHSVQVLNPQCIEIIMRSIP